MPTYIYRCTICEREAEVVHGMTVDVVVPCATCGGQTRRRPAWSGRVGHNPFDVMLEKMDKNFAAWKQRQRRKKHG